MDKRKPKSGEKRKSPRKKSYSLVSFVEKNGELDTGSVTVGRTLNISAGGIRLESMEPMEQGQVLDMEIAIGNRVFGLHGEVVYCRRIREGLYAVGVRFQKPEDELTEKLE
jgi:hypothetical protein